MKPVTFINEVTDEDRYPCSDGKPMAETGIHLDVLILLYQILSERYRGQNVLVGADQFWYWEEGNPKAVIAPDVYVMFNVEPGPRRSIKSWVEKTNPAVIFEMASKRTWRKNLGKTKDLYEQLGVKEYFLVDPEFEFFDYPVIGFRLQAKGKYEPILPGLDNGVISEQLGVKIVPRVSEKTVYLYDGKTGARLLSPLEQVRATEERFHEAEETIEQERQQLEQQRQRIDDLQTEVENLKKLLEIVLHGKKHGKRS